MQFKSLSLYKLDKVTLVVLGLEKKKDLQFNNSLHLKLTTTLRTWKRMTFKNQKKGKISKLFGETYRSRFEMRIAQQIIDTGLRIDYENLKVTYIKPATNHFYLPDFRLPNNIFIEAKGLFDVKDRQKHTFIQEQYPLLDIRFVFQNARNTITKKSKTTYGKWCDKKGFMWSEGYIPEVWFKEELKEIPYQIEGGRIINANSKSE